MFRGFVEEQLVGIVQECTIVAVVSGADREFEVADDRYLHPRNRSADLVRHVLSKGNRAHRRIGGLSAEQRAQRGQETGHGRLQSGLKKGPYSAAASSASARRSTAMTSMPL